MKNNGTPETAVVVQAPDGRMGVKSPLSIANGDCPVYGPPVDASLNTVQVRELPSGVPEGLGKCLLANA